MEGKFSQNNLNEMRSQIREWWNDLTEQDLDSIEGNQDQLIRVLQNRYGYTRNLAFLEVTIRMASYQEEEEYEEREKPFNNKNIKALKYSSYDKDDWLETKSSR